MNTIPRPHRRRREKKLMTMEEVTDRFPVTKYKAWKSSRETEGLPTSGGIATAPASRAASMKDVEGVISAKDEGASSIRPDTALSMAREDQATANSSAQPISPRASHDVRPKEADKDVEKSPVVATTTESFAPTKETSPPTDDSDDEDDPIRTATAPELLAEPGDTCAICLDTLEEDDDVRGLTCGHAFHASCVDPWLTARRACCPLCKADYYVPKPRPEGEAEQTQGGRLRTGLRSPTHPQAVWTTNRGNLFSRSRVIVVGPGGAQTQSVDRFGRFARPSRQAAPQTEQSTTMPAPTWQSRILSVPGRHLFSRPDNAVSAASPTPGQLEAGNR